MQICMSIDKGDFTILTRELLVQNILVNYGKYGVTEDMIAPIVDGSYKDGMSYDLIYLNLCREISEMVGEEFLCTSSDMARAFGVSEEEINKLIEESIEELKQKGENPDDYFKSVQSTRYMM